MPRRSSTPDGLIPVAVRQVLVLARFDPSAHRKDGYPHFALPSSPETIGETLRAARACSEAGIGITVYLPALQVPFWGYSDHIPDIPNSRIDITNPASLTERIQADLLHWRAELGCEDCRAPANG